MLLLSDQRSSKCGGFIGNPCTQKHTGKFLVVTNNSKLPLILLVLLKV